MSSSTSSNPDDLWTPPAWVWIVIVIGLLLILIVCYGICRWRRTRRQERELLRFRNDSFSEPLLLETFDVRNGKQVEGKVTSLDTPLGECKVQALHFSVYYPAHWTQSVQNLGDTFVVQFTCPESDPVYQRFRVVSDRVRCTRLPTATLLVVPKVVITL